MAYQGTGKLTWDKARKAALERDEETCQRCLRPATDVHHRKVKGMGGTGNDEVAFGLANLVSLCRECHCHVHANPGESYVHGWLVHSWDRVEEIPGRDKYDF